MELFALKGKAAVVTGAARCITGVTLPVDSGYLAR